MSLDEKYKHLQSILSDFNSAVIAFSGGVDSTLLLKVACDTLGTDKVLALTATSPIFPSYEIEQSRKLANEFGVRQQFVDSGEIKLNDFVENNLQRCYHCKHNMLNRFLQTITVSSGVLLDGSNLDDQQDYRPGQKAVTELKIRSPLLEAKFSKDEIRTLSRQLNLSTWNKQPFACLATRFPYGTRITTKRLQQVDRCETWLRLHNFSFYRVRCHDQLARIEVGYDEISRLLDKTLHADLVTTFKANGFDYVTLDLQGYRSGSMNEVLPATNTL
ncbi:ATP-dependent sacrificial sulfur transferase LarE [uncultured Desulfuromusa sp.]|uniref:ATP-dependent sacrificial sulfur transferase LarE n=1 Tax=uncultured Desulfuromusa sp. TaxID=219183 RepID=UPI002AA7403E|nr:ATP-dependent sacrificial sulfur transferase LarE [uncultured Desulfuromusa sp.]